eukprot:TRINITY_DN11696_c0_g1_i6.p1 TRINITY_DN11696_c0_g1~~TRINITY_DN11696_c0_g1_i6.p1  ORF type:complete len:152 (-),score=42.11 TRINITY_DN11696_c0_g1_i6:28-438(-)
MSVADALTTSEGRPLSARSIEVRPLSRSNSSLLSSTAKPLLRPLSAKVGDAHITTVPDVSDVSGMFRQRMQLVRERVKSVLGGSDSDGNVNGNGQQRNGAISSSSGVFCLLCLCLCVCVFHSFLPNIPHWKFKCHT